MTVAAEGFFMQTNVRARNKPHAKVSYFPPHQQRQVSYLPPPVVLWVGRRLLA
jgi:hypothetical protein